MKRLISMLLFTTIAFPVDAQGLLDGLKSGAGKVGNVAKKGVAAVGTAVEATGDLVKNEEPPEATRVC